MTNENYALENAFINILNIFSTSEEGGTFFLKYILIPDEKESDRALEIFYEEISNAFKDEVKIGESVIESLKTIRKIILAEPAARIFVENQINQVLQYKAMVNYVNDKPSEEFLKNI
ncbi:MAG: hypothetical protein MTP17_04770 [Candidatus Midichloria sp.]|nr:MAG: hypothetical protein MTP17_04770 [Candidatus Midichloria sp.]